MAAGLVLATAAVGQDDDWEFQEDAAQHITIAAARYDAGQMIVVQCRDNKLAVVLTGLPQSAEPLQLAATRADGRSDEQRWVASGAPGAYRAVSPGRVTRFLKGGGLYSVHTEDGAATAFRGAFDLPSASANLDRVLTACGWALTDERDLLAEAAVTVDRTGPSVHRRAPSRSVALRSARREPDVPATPPPPTPELEVSCIVRDMHLRECRADHPPSAELEPVTGAIRFAEGREVFPTEGADAAVAEGRVLHVTTSTQLVRVVRRPQ